MANFWNILSKFQRKKTLREILQSLPKEYTVREHAAYQKHPISHAVFSPYGIFFLQYKSGKGLISGTPASDFWRRLDGKNVYRFRNPLKISYRSFRPMAKAAGIPITAFHNLCVLDENARFEEGSSALVHLSQVRDVLLSYTDKVLTKEQLNRALRLLEAQKKGKTCPRCGARLVKRHGKNGDFLGCSNYPECTYTEDL